MNEKYIYQNQNDSEELKQINNEENNENNN